MNNQIETTDFLTFQQKVGKYELTTQKLDILYKQTDPRAWTAIINPLTNNIIVTYFINRHDLGDRNFDIISSNKNYYEIETDDIYQTLDLIVKAENPTTTKE